VTCPYFADIITWLCDLWHFDFKIWTPVKRKGYVYLLCSSCAFLFGNYLSVIKICLHRDSLFGIQWQWLIDWSYEMDRLTGRTDRQTDDGDQSLMPPLLRSSDIITIHTNFRFKAFFCSTSEEKNKKKIYKNVDKSYGTRNRSRAMIERYAPAFTQRNGFTLRPWRLIGFWVVRCNRQFQYFAKDDWRRRVCRHVVEGLTKETQKKSHTIWRKNSSDYYFRFACVENWLYQWLVPALRDRVTLTFEFLTSKLLNRLSCVILAISANCQLFRLCVVKSEARTDGRTERRTDRLHN